MSSLFGRAPGERRKSWSASRGCRPADGFFAGRAKDGRRHLADPAGPGGGALAGF